MWRPGPWPTTARLSDSALKGGEREEGGRVRIWREREAGYGGSREIES